MKYLFVLQISLILFHTAFAQSGLSTLRLIQKIREQEEGLKKIMDNKERLYDIGSTFESVMKKAAQLDSNYWSSLPVSEECQTDFQDMLTAAFSLITKKNPYPNWDPSFIISQLDACGKPGPGIFHGNLQWMGAYQECTNISVLRPPMSTRDDLYTTGYCRAAFSLNPQLFGRRKKRSVPHSEATCGGGAFSGGSGILLQEDLCLPKGCANEHDATVLLQNLTGGATSPICFVGCMDLEHNTLSGQGVVVTVVMCLTVVVTLVATIVDYFWFQDNKDHNLAKAIPMRMLLAFSLYTNTVEIFAAKNRPGTIGPVHCIRVFSMLWVIAGHVFLVGIQISNNPLDAITIVKKFAMQLILNAFFSVDSFFFLSGLLLGFMWFKELKRNRKAVMAPSAWVMFYVHRILRLSPPYFMIIAFYTWVFPYFLKQSPLFIGAGDLLVGSCPKNWWLNFIYLNNIIDYDNQCYGIAWYLATDMQIHIFAPLVLVPLALSPLVGFIIAGLLLALSAAASMYTIYHFHMPASGFNSPYSVQDPQYTVDPGYYTFYVYDAPWIRFPIYLMGILLGYYLQTNNRKVTIPKLVNIGGWVLSFVLMLTVLFGLHDYMTGTEVSLFWRAMYTAFSKPAWGLGLCWIVFSCYYGYGGPFDRFLSWNIWIPLSRLTYSAYLVHLMVAVYVVSTPYQPSHWSGTVDIIIHQLVPTFVLSYLMAILWSSFFEISTSKVEMLFLGNLRKRPHKEEVAPAGNGKPTETWVIDNDKNTPKF